MYSLRHAFDDDTDRDIVFIRNDIFYVYIFFSFCILLSMCLLCLHSKAYGARRSLNEGEKKNTRVNNPF